MDAMPDHPIPDARGINLHHADPDAAALHALYLPPDLAAHLARRAASGLYHATTAITLAWEAEQASLPHRRALAQLVLLHRLTPRDLLAEPKDDAFIDTVLGAA